MERKKWWEIARSQDEIDLFHVLARHPKFNWRTSESLLKKLNWSQDHLEKVIEPFLKSRILLVRRTKKKSIQLGYWERVDKDFDDRISDEDLLEMESVGSSDPNVL